MIGKEVDSLVRGVISDYGYGQYFIYSIGYGIGLDIYEFFYILLCSGIILEEGMVFFVEFGIYIFGFFGVCIEDLVVIKNFRVEFL